LRKFYAKEIYFTRDLTKFVATISMVGPILTDI